MKAAVYCGTRNLYKQMIHAAKSLLIYSDVDKIYFLIEDDKFPYDLPPEIECRNVSNQTYFPPDGPNFNENYNLTYMVLLRAAFTKIFPDLDRILTIDVDTLVRDNISNLWDLDLTDYYLAAVPEYKLSKELGYPYINMGVAMLNLDKMRKDKMDDKLIAYLNKYFYLNNEQDCINELCRDKILVLPTDYNGSWLMERPKHERIMHFAAIKDWAKWPYFHIYDDLPFEEIKRNQNFKITLDIIIPTYKDQEGLRNTLNSISKSIRPYINIIVVNDGDGLDYYTIKKEYPYIYYYELEKNSGPGMARQYGLDHSNGSYVVFLDTGDLFIPGGDKIILNTIRNNFFYDIYCWGFYDKNTKRPVRLQSQQTIGYVYRREFIKAHNIHFCKEGSYYNEDYGFNQACLYIINYYNSKHIMRLCYNKMAIFKVTQNDNSLTEQGKKRFLYKDVTLGKAINNIHANKIALNNHLSVYNILPECINIMCELYFFFIRTYQERSEYTEFCWDAAKYYYDNCYSTYIKIVENRLDLIYHKKYLPRIIKGIKYTKHFSPNINRFLHELEENDFIPVRYLE